MSARKRSTPTVEPVGDLLTMLEQVPEQVTPARETAPEVLPVAPEHEAEPLLEAAAPQALTVPLTPTPAGVWVRVTVEAAPKPGTVVRVDGTQLMIWRNLYLTYERRQGEHSALSIPRDHALLVVHPDPGNKAPLYIVALSRIEVAVKGHVNGGG